ncbi:MAG: hypothetical protein U9N34_08035 [Candidatus Cloacimonadota bacterium]|nr:hypothetical protein [Candidatus Cloacimonadota bacterium]
MIAKLIKISDLKAKAVGEVVEYLVNKPKSFVPSFFGKPATNLDWYKKSMHFYKLATKTNSAKKISYLMNALIDIYKCTELMKQSKFNDEKITAGQKKIERFYLNYVLNFIEESLQDIDKIKDYEIVENAIAILSETNSNIASKYKRHLTNHISGSDYHQRILELLRTPNANFTSEISVRINMAFNYNKKFYEKKKKNKNQLIKSITKKINDKYLYFNKKIDNELQKNNPSIYTILEYIKKFEEIANPINRILENSYKNKFLDLKEALENILTFMQNDYQYAKKSFKYLSLSHNRLDIKRILDSQKSLSNMNFDKIKKYEEISELSPSISVMKRKFDKSLNNYFK